MKKNYLNILPFIALAIAMYMFSGFTGKINEDCFKTWNYSQSAVFGLMKLENTSNRSYYKITKIDNQSTKIREYNAAGIVVGTTVVRFFNGRLNMMTSTDQWGNTYETAKFAPAGVDEFIVTRINTGKNSYLPCKSAKYIYKNNMLAEIRYLSYAGKLCNNANGVAIIRYKRYDDKNRYSLTKELSFYSADGAPVISKSYDCHKVVYDLDERGNQQSVAYFGNHDEPLTNRYGGFKNKYAYDENDNCTKNDNIGLNEEVTANSNGIATVLYTYKNGFLVQETRYDEKNNIVQASASGDGIAIVRNEFDDRGNLTQKLYYDKNNQPVNNNSGYQKAVYKYSPSNMLVNIEYFDQNQAAAADAGGIHRYSYGRDDKCRITRIAYFDKDNNPVKDNLDQVYMVKYKYDEFGRKSSTTYWKDSVTKMQRWNGLHESIIRYNAEGQDTEGIYLDDNGNLFKTSDGYSRQVIKYNPDASIAARSFFDSSTPVVLSNTAFASNFHSIKYTYDNNARIASLEYFDTTDAPANANIGFAEADKFACHKVEFIYNGNRIIQENCYPANSETPIKVIDCLKNDFINTSGLSYGHKNQ